MWSDPTTTAATTNELFNSDYLRAQAEIKIRLDGRSRFNRLAKVKSKDKRQHRPDSLYRNAHKSLRIDPGLVALYLKL